jgi:hypothetical protein
MPTTNIDSRLMSFGELLTGNNSYIVPDFQRDYSWTETEVDELWTDITNTLDENRNEHFFGAIVVNNSDKPKLRLIDGQQRITTTSLLMCVLRNMANEKDDTQLSSIISQKYLGSLDTRTRRTEPKLRLNDTNNQFYQENFVEPKDIIYLRKIKKFSQGQHKSNKLMIESYILLYDKIEERASKSLDFIESLIQIEECIRDKFNSIVISVADESNSYLIFETLNNRGLELSVADLLKNHLFSKSSEKLPEIQRKWIEINQEIDKFDLTKFIRHYWISNYGDVSEKDLFRKISTQLKSSLEVFDFVNSLRNSSEIYGAFKNPQSSIWDSYPQDVKSDIARLRVFDANECYPALLAAKEVLNPGSFLKLLKMIVIFSFRYTVICNLNPNKLETMYGEISTHIRKRKPKSTKEIAGIIAKLDPEDDIFSEAFQKKILNKNQTELARYILQEINSNYVGNKELVANPNSSEVNLEHVLPQKPSEAWLAKFSKTDPGHYVYRLGNLALLESKVNRTIGNSSFQEKCSKAFSSSRLEITREISENTVWGPKQIEERQEKMAKAASKIWNLALYKK